MIEQLEEFDRWIRCTAMKISYHTYCQESNNMINWWFIIASFIASFIASLVAPFIASLVASLIVYKHMLDVDWILRTYRFKDRCMYYLFICVTSGQLFHPKWMLQSIEICIFGLSSWSAKHQRSAKGHVMTPALNCWIYYLQTPDLNFRILIAIDLTEATNATKPKTTASVASRRPDTKSTVWGGQVLWMFKRGSYHSTKGGSGDAFRSLTRESKTQSSWWRCE